MSERPIDWEFVRYRRLELGLKRGDVCRATGHASHMMRKIEAGQYNGSRVLSADRLLELARLLGVRVQELFSDFEPELTEHGIANARRVGAALRTNRRAMRPTALAYALGLTLAELREAGDALDRQLEPAGMRLIRVPQWRLTTQARALTPAEHKALAAYDRARFGLNTEPATVLLRVIDGEIGHAARGPNEPRLLGGLMRHGIVQDDGRGGYGLHPDVAYSLGLPARAGRARTRRDPAGDRRR
jgi:transcriptional regulator with XRE-family HTH domain